MPPSKYNNMKILKSVYSRSDQICESCGRTIPAFKDHYRIKLTDKHIITSVSVSAGIVLENTG
jgi:hypothetical protein